MFNGKIHYKWQFSIAMLNYQRVYGKNMFQSPPTRHDMGVSIVMGVAPKCWMVYFMENPIYKGLQWKIPSIDG